MKTAQPTPQPAGDAVTTGQLADLLEWHRRDGTRKGQLTVMALTELETARAIQAKAVGRDAAMWTADPIEALRRIEEMGGPASYVARECLKRARALQAGKGDDFAPVFAELERAVRKFPTWPTDPLHAAGVLNEEVGELNKAILQAVYEPHKSGPDHVREEALQAAAMSLRFFVSLNRYDYKKGEQHQQGEV